MDQSTFTKLTGLSLSSRQGARFDSVAGLAGETLEEMLGWPLDPTDWDNQYVETGKTRPTGDYSFSSDTTDLEPADPVLGATRLFEWHRYEPYLAIDPVTTIHSVKLVRNGITYKTFDPIDYRIQLTNGRPAFGKYLAMGDRLCNWLGDFWSHPVLVYRSNGDSHFTQVAVDADWAFSEADGLPTPLQKVWADLVAYELDLKRDIKSETMLSHSYSRDKRADPAQTHQATIAKYAGPKGTVGNPDLLIV